MLSPRSGGSEGIDPQILGQDLHLHILRLGHHRHRGRRGVDPALGLGLRHPLHPVDPALKFEPVVDAGR